MKTEELNPTPPPARPGRSGRGAAVAIAATGLLGGALIAGAAIATAATPSPSPGTGSSSGAAHDPSQGGHVGANGVVETLLTGTTADNARAAALAAVPGATIERMETDAEGAVYEAHMVKSDGTHVTVKMDATFKVTGIETGPNRPAQNG